MPVAMRDVISNYILYLQTNATAGVCGDEFSTMLETVTDKLITDIEASQTIQVSEATVCLQQLLSSPFTEPQRSCICQALNAKSLRSTIQTPGVLHSSDNKMQDFQAQHWMVQETLALMCDHKVSQHRAMQALVQRCIGEVGVFFPLKYLPTV